MLSQHDGRAAGSDGPADGLHDPANCVVQVDFQGFDETAERQDRHVILASLDASDVRPMHARFLGQFLLRPAPIFADLTQVLTQPHQRRVFLSSHTVKVQCRIAELYRV